MEQTPRPKPDFSAITVHILTIIFLLYVSWMLRHTGSYLRAVAMYALMMPGFISIWRELRGCGKITRTEQWVFIVIAMILWIIQSFLTGKLHYLMK